ncbi:Glycosyltransferase 6 [Quillaja saponaria]|uniref:Glycosyltransferase 6 n=1 Tax=Quillaja saponaria TaxID=32244 RepID=A0AAD7KR57_QUISA|nr:Glycosyltransferase 6 [Quillaja saponaria]
MAKVTPQKKACSCVSDGFLSLGSVLIAVLLLWSLLYTTQNSHTIILFGSNSKVDSNIAHDPPEKTFYDDRDLSYSIEKPMKNWNEKRKQWLQVHPSFAAGAQDRILLLTGSQPSVCKNRIGDHLLLRLFKNKVDYARLHGYDIFYNNAYLHPKMDSYWAKIPIMRASMMAHPEVEWIWWMDLDAVFTDMEFKLPMERYKNHNLVVHGWPNMVYEDKDNKSWTGLNAGVFLIRNCQWSMDLMDAWSKIGPWTPNFEKWGQILKSMFKDKPFPLPDDQSALIYLLFTEREKWEVKVYLEGEYNLEAYWKGVEGKLENISEVYREIEEGTTSLRRRHAEKLSYWYGASREKYLKEKGLNPWNGRRPFTTHFTGCQPCNGEHNPSYDGNACWREMERALNFADNQVLRNYGFVHKDLLSSSVYPVPFDYPWIDSS